MFFFQTDMDQKEPDDEAILLNLDKEMQALVNEIQTNEQSLESTPELIGSLAILRKLNELRRTHATMLGQKYQLMEQRKSGKQEVPARCFSLLYLDAWYSLVSHVLFLAENALSSLDREELRQGNEKGTQKSVFVFHLSVLIFPPSVCDQVRERVPRIFD